MSSKKGPLDPAERSHRPTLAQVAAAAGVSLPTVSKVLNRRDGVSEATRRSVDSLLVAHGYVRRRSLERSTPLLIDLVMVGLDGSWPASVASGVEAAAYEAGLHVAVSVARGTETRAVPRQGDWVDRLIERGSAGVIVGLVDLIPTQRERLDRARIPIVVIHPLRDPPPSIASVGVNAWAGAYDATEHLIGLGHRRIGLVTGPQRQLSEQARIAGYRSAMSAAEIDVPADLIRHGSYDRASGKKLVSELISLPEPPTALFICSDHMAIGGYEALAYAHLSVPNDVSVVGFDDLPEARWVYPPLTTVRQPLKDMGRAAVQLLVRLINGEELTSKRVEFTTTLIVRASTTAI